MAVTNFKYVLTEFRDEIFLIKLNRPEKANAYNGDMALEIAESFDLAKASQARMVFLTGEGKNFCGGADLEWMRNQNKINKLDNIKKMYESIISVDIPIIAKIQGSIFGGGLGLIACCDIVFADKNSQYSISEAKWGLIPGIASPFILNKIGVSKFTELSISARVFNFDEAINIKLVHHEISKVDDFIEMVKLNNLNSIIQIKKQMRANFLSQLNLDQLSKESNYLINTNISSN